MRMKTKNDIFTYILRTYGMEFEREYRFHPVRMWRFDYASIEKKIAIEVEGGVYIQGRHTRPQGFLKDIEKYNTATAMGWRVFRCTPDTKLSDKFIKFINDVYFEKKS